MDENSSTLAANTAAVINLSYHVCRLYMTERKGLSMASKQLKKHAWMCSNNQRCTNLAGEKTTDMHKAHKLTWRWQQPLYSQPYLYTSENYSSIDTLRGPQPSGDWSEHIKVLHKVTQESIWLYRSRESVARS